MAVMTTGEFLVHALMLGVCMCGFVLFCMFMANRSRIDRRLREVERRRLADRRVRDARASVHLVERRVYDGADQ